MTAFFAETRQDLTASYLAGAPQLRAVGAAEQQIDDATWQELLRRKEKLGRRSVKSTARIVDLGLLLARLEGLEQDEIAVLLNVSQRRLTSLVRQVETIPARQGDKIVRILRIVADLHKVIDRQGTARWFRLSIPELGDRTPIEALARGDHDRVEALVQSYLDPPYT